MSHAPDDRYWGQRCLNVVLVGFLLLFVIVSAVVTLGEWLHGAGLAALVLLLFAIGVAVVRYRDARR